MSSLNDNMEHLMRLISEGNLDRIRELIVSGLCPTKCSKTTRSGIRSPICCALGKGKLKIAHFFCDIGFLTLSDLANKKRAQTLRKRLKNKHQKQVKFLDDLCFHPMSLNALCLIAVRSCVGTDREKVTNLPIPKAVQDTINFSNINKQVDYSDDDVGSLDTSRDSDSDYDTRDWDYLFTSHDQQG